MFYFTNDQIDEIEKRLAVRAKKDTDFDPISDAGEDDLVAIIHNGRNMICRLDKLPGRLVAKRYDEIPAEITEENILETPTAFSISVIKTLLGIEQLDEFDNDTPYTKDSCVKHIDDDGILRGYIFTSNKEAGYWDDSVVTEINYDSIMDQIGSILSEFKENGRVYVLESYFTDGKANKSIADEDGVNLKQYYAKKTDIPDVNREIAEAIAVKLDNTPKGSHNRPIYIAPDPSTGYGKSEVIDSLDVPGEIHSESDIHSYSNIYAYGGVAAGGIADLSHSGSSNEGTTVVEFDSNVEYEEGHEYIPSHGKVKLPAYRDWDDIKPDGGVELEDLEQDVQISLNKADTAYQKPQDGIPKTDLESAVQTSLGKADTAYQKPQDGIEKEDLEADVQASLDKADTAVQPEDMPTVVEYGDLGSETTEDTTRIPTAFGVNVVKGHINVEGLTEFSTSVAYKRGDLCKVTDGIGVARGYRFEEGKVAGAWDANKVQRLTYVTLAQPLNVTEDDMNSILTIE